MTLELFFPVKLCGRVVIQFSYLINVNVSDITFCSKVWLHKIPDDITTLFSPFSSVKLADLVAVVHG